MDWKLWTLIFLIGNAFIGACIWAFIDDENENLYKWYKDADNLGFLGPFIKFVILHAWSIGLYMKHK